MKLGKLGLLLLVWGATATAVEPPTLLNLLPGDTEFIVVAEAAEVIVGDPTVIDVRQLNAGPLAVAALQPGRSQLIIIANGQQQRLDVYVHAQVEPQQQATVEFIVQHFPQLSVATKAPLQFLRGTVSADEQQQLLAWTSRYPQLILQTTVAERAQRVMIELAVKIVEVKRAYSQQLGLRWPTSITGPTLSHDSEQWFVWPLEVTGQLELLAREGHARVLAEPVLSAYSGGEAEFLVGGELPLPQVLAQGQQDVSFRDYGVRLNIAPTLLADDRINTTLDAEISALDPAVAVNGIPGISTKRIRSMLELRVGESIVLSGLISHQQAQQVDSYPGLLQLPLLGSLFGSEGFRSEQTEVLVMVTPRLSTIQRDQSDRLQQSRQHMDSYRRQIGCLGLRDQEQA